MKISKILLVAALMIVGVNANAQETERVEFNPHMFLQLQGGAQYTLGEADFNKLISPNAQLGRRAGSGMRSLRGPERSAGQKLFS